MITAAALLLATFLAGTVTCRLALGLVRRQKLIDRPNLRSSHDRPTPRGGGIGILMALLPGVVAGALLLEGPRAEVVAAVAVATLLLALLGFVDDRRGAGPGLKVLLQLAAGGVTIVAIGAIEGVSLPGGYVALGILAVPLTLFWLVGFSNGFNFMDGIDGIAALHGGVAALLLSAAALHAGGPGWLAVPLAGACLAFLTVNWAPAKVFMGDVGSLPVGFLLALAAVLGAGAGVPFVASFLMLGPFLFDTIYTIIRRALRGENVISAHRSHLYQRLVILGFSHRSVTVVYGLWTLLTGGLGLMYLTGGTGLRVAALGAALLSGVGVAIVVRFLEQARGA